MAAEKYSDIWNKIPTYSNINPHIMQFELNNKYDFIFPLGAGKKVDEAIDKFIEKYGFEKLNEVAKCNFKKIKENLNLSISQ